MVLGCFQQHLTKLMHVEQSALTACNSIYAYAFKWYMQKISWTLTVKETSFLNKTLNLSDFSLYLRVLRMRPVNYRRCYVRIACWEKSEHQQQQWTKNESIIHNIWLIDNTPATHYSWCDLQHIGPTPVDDLLFSYRYVPLMRYPTWRVNNVLEWKAPPPLIHTCWKFEITSLEHYRIGTTYQPDISDIEGFMAARQK